MGYSDFDRGFALRTVGLVATSSAPSSAGCSPRRSGSGASLWIFGFLQIFSNVGYVLVAGSAGRTGRSCTARHRLRALPGPGQRRVLGAAAAHDAEALLGHPVRPLLQPLRAAAHPRGTGRRRHGRCHRLARLLLFTIFSGIPGMVMLARFALGRPRAGVPRGRASAKSAPLDRRRAGEGVERRCRWVARERDLAWASSGVSAHGGRDEGFSLGAPLLQPCGPKPSASGRRRSEPSSWPS